MGQELRFYGFGNFYLSQIQHGLQAAHVVGNMSTQYDKESDYYNWAKNYKTMILLNGGNAHSLNTLVSYFGESWNTFDWGYFNEDHESLNGCITSVGIILPERIYGYDENYDENLTPDEVVFALNLKRYKLA
ncbi:MAG: hypothetical protein WC679_01850 [Bacteroidales bacterium]|jgi:hypothetical protein